MSKSTVKLSKVFENEESFLRNKQNNAYLQANVKRGLAVYVVDALIDECMRNKGCGDLCLGNNTFVPVKLKRQIHLDKDVKCEVTRIDREGEKMHVIFEVTSETLSSAELVVWLDRLHERYMDSLENELGNGLFFLHCL